MRVSDLDLLFVPEAGPVSPDHWIARWSGKLSTAQRVEAEGAGETVPRLIAQAQAASRPVVLIGHSTGAVAAALAAPDLPRTVLGAFLVAPPDDATLATLDGGWPSPPRARLPFASVLLASRTDPWAALPASQALAQDWGAEFVDVGEAGRLDAESGHGPWPDGLLKLAGFLKRLA